MTLSTNISNLENSLRNLDKLLLKTQEQVESHVNNNNKKINIQEQKNLEKLFNELVNNYQESINIIQNKDIDKKFSPEIIINNIAGTASKIIALSMLAGLNNLATDFLLTKITFQIEEQNINNFLAKTSQQLVYSYISKKRPNLLPIEIILNMSNFAEKSQENYLIIAETSKKYIYAFPKISEANNILVIYDLLTTLRKNIIEQIILKNYTTILFDTANKIISDNIHEGKSEELFLIYDDLSKINVNNEYTEKILNSSIFICNAFIHEQKWNKISDFFEYIKKIGNTTQHQITKTILARNIIENYLISKDTINKAFELYKQIDYNDEISIINHHKIQSLVSLIIQSLNNNKSDEADMMINELVNFNGYSNDIILHKSSGVLELIKYYSNNDNIQKAVILCEELKKIGESDSYALNILQAHEIIILMYLEKGEYQKVINLYNSILPYNKISESYCIQGKIAEQIIKKLLSQKVLIDDAISIFDSLRNIAEKDGCLDSYARAYNNFIYYLQNHQLINNLDVQLNKDSFNEILIKSATLLIYKYSCLKEFDAAIEIFINIQFIDKTNGNINELMDVVYYLIQSLAEATKSTLGYLIYLQAKEIDKRIDISENKKNAIIKLAQAYKQKNEDTKFDIIIKDLNSKDNNN